ncbi:hypothetical protein CC85DRAFT_112635 [Cutaneotrichosporon oleaginosum]|uniref:Uncharacterized protein n=1 Tax=Cutaneotrichosporon oleaginosum TaxID=879819 RepID=A0A0J0XX59_9TREE|nr:uncharacterized protein CC85DRAFT_112635 [Cutaneotrichosporon oleaginosum]KLT45635.1 hypothetical protein CC85DRAFT_112635 [Cutaneotrichosporon oleaginosum]TXT04571.1 hypothetical protein COLE_07390 [Cutaneotrichosporon oleaginosum]
MHVSTVAALLLVAPLALAGMYAKPVINIDAKEFKKVMGKEHAAVSQLGWVQFADCSRW